MPWLESAGASGAILPPRDSIGARRATCEWAFGLRRRASMRPRRKSPTRFNSCAIIILGAAYSGYSDASRPGSHARAEAAP